MPSHQVWYWSFARTFAASRACRGGHQNSDRLSWFERHWHFQFIPSSNARGCHIVSAGQGGQGVALLNFHQQPAQNNFWGKGYLRVICQMLGHICISEPCLATNKVEPCLTCMPFGIWLTERKSFSDMLTSLLASETFMVLGTDHAVQLARGFSA